MSAFRSMRIASFRAASISRVGATRSFQTSRVLGASKETAEGTEARKAEIDSAKDKQLKDQKEGKNEWHSTLASESESVIKADRGDVKADKGTIEELQKESAKAAQQERK